MVINKQRAIIGFKAKGSKTIETVEVLYNGGPFLTGSLLTIRYTDIHDVKALFSNGYTIFNLGVQTEPRKGVPHKVKESKGNVDFKGIDPEVTVFKSRDTSGVEQNPLGFCSIPKPYTNVTSIVKKEKVEFIYIYDESLGSWLTYQNDKKERKIIWLHIFTLFDKACKNLEGLGIIDCYSSQDKRYLEKICNLNEKLVMAIV